MRFQPTSSYTWMTVLSCALAACGTDPSAGSDSAAGGSGAGSGQTGGSTSTGGAGVGGSGGGTGGTAAGGSGTGGTSGGEFMIDGGFVTVCDWSGYAWTTADDASTVTPSGFGSVDAPPLCIEGSVAPEMNFGGYAILGINIGQTTGTSTSADIAPGGTGVYVDVDNPGGTELRIQLQNAAGESWCEVYEGPDFYAWSGFNQNCWDDSGAFYLEEPINAIVVAVPGHNLNDRPYELCLNGISCTDPAGGTGGTGSGGTSGGGKFVGNITTQDAVNTNGRIFSTYWDQITPENAGKWGSVEQSPGNYNWATLDAIYDYATDNGIVFKQHTFVWGNQQPGFSIGETQVRNWMNAFCDRYPETALIDVVNEPPPHTEPDYAGAIGGGTNGSWQWIINAFEWADEACPDAVLMLNDYNNIEYEDQNEHFIDIVQTLQAASAPIDAVGAQAHDLDMQDFEVVKALLANLHDETGLPVYITEYDPSTQNDTTQLAWYQEHIPYLLAQDYVPGITIWGWIYGQTWDLAPYSGLIRDGSPRPAMTWLMQELGRPAP